MLLKRIRDRIERSYITIAVWYYFIGKEIRSGFKGFGLKRLILFFRGFHYKKTIPFDFNKWKYSDYISDFEQEKLQFINHPYNKLLNNKLVFSTYFGAFFRTPQSYCVINKGSVFSVSKCTSINNINDIEALLKQSKKLMLKPLEGMDGAGIYLITFDDGNYRVNYKIYSELDLERFISSLDDYLLEEFIEQGSFTKRMHPDSTNTLRVITLIDPVTSSPIIPIATLRIGTSISAPIDFFPRGGLISYITIDNGQLSGAMTMSDSDGIVYFDKHPETHEQIKGRILPGWNELVNEILRTARAVAPLLKIVGWDIVLTEDGFTVIEGNTGPDTKIQGLDYPLAKNPKVLDFLKHHRIR